MTSSTTHAPASGSGLIVRATMLAATLTVLGALFGMARDLLLARYFGATGQTDAFLVAWTVPETASPLLIEGAMAFLMVPIFVRALADQTGLSAVVRATLPRLIAFLSAAALITALAAPMLVHVLAPGLADPALAVRCTRITAITVLAFGLAGYLGAALRSAHLFGWATSIYIAYNVGILGAMLLLHRTLGVQSAAIGVAIGAVFMVAIQLPSFLRRLEPAASVVRPHVALGAFIPIATFVVTRHAQVFVERFLGSQLPAGTISHLNYAQKVAQMPVGLSVMLATVTFPMLARSIASGDEMASSKRMEWDLRVVSAVVLVASAYIIAFAKPIIEVVFQRGEFVAADTSATAAIMRVYAIGLLAQAAIAVLSRSYFSDRTPTWYPGLVMAAGLLATVVISTLLLPMWHGVAIAAGNAAGITLAAALMFGGLRRRMAAVSVRCVGLAVIRLGLLAGAAGLAGWLLCRLMGDLPAPFVAAAGVVAVAAVFLILGTLTGAEEARRLGALMKVARHAQ
jgi:putative peptidoglycan lipid II flippase